jgi:hypothetical protein
MSVAASIKRRHTRSARLQTPWPSSWKSVMTNRKLCHHVSRWWLNVCASPYVGRFPKSCQPNHSQGRTSIPSSYRPAARRNGPCGPTGVKLCIPHHMMPQSRGSEPANVNPGRHVWYTWQSAAHSHKTPFTHLHCPFKLKGSVFSRVYNVCMKKNHASVSGW